MADKTHVTATGSINIGVLIERYLAGQDGNKFNSLFEGEIKEKLIKPLFEKIESRLRSAPVQVGSLQLDSILQEAVSKIKISDSNINELNNAINSSFKFVADNIKEKFATNFLDSEKLSKATDSLINNLTANIAKIEFDPKLEGSDLNLMQALIGGAPEFGFLNRLRYQNLIEKFLKKIETFVSSPDFNIADASKPLNMVELLQQMISNSDTDPLSGFFGNASKEYKQTVSKLLTKINEGIDAYKFDESSTKPPIDVNGLLSIILNSTDVDPFGSWWSVFTESNRSKYTKLVKTLLDKIESGVSGINFAKDATLLDFNLLLNHILEDSSAQGLGREFFGLKTANKEAYNDVVKSLLEKLKSGIDKYEFDSVGPLDMTFLINTLLEGGRLGIGGKWEFDMTGADISIGRSANYKKYKELAGSLINKIQESINSLNFNISEEPITVEKLFKLLNINYAEAPSSKSEYLRGLFDKFTSLLPSDREASSENEKNIQKVALTKQTIRSLKKELDYTELFQKSFGGLEKAIINSNDNLLQKLTEIFEMFSSSTSSLTSKPKELPKENTESAGSTAIKRISGIALAGVIAEGAAVATAVTALAGGINNLKNWAEKKLTNDQTQVIDNEYYAPDALKKRIAEIEIEKKNKTLLDFNDIRANAYLNLYKAELEKTENYLKSDEYYKRHPEITPPTRNDSLLLPTQNTNEMAALTPTAINSPSTQPYAEQRELITFLSTKFDSLFSTLSLIVQLLKDNRPSPTTMPLEQAPAMPYNPIQQAPASGGRPQSLINMNNGDSTRQYRTAFKKTSYSNFEIV